MLKRYEPGIRGELRMQIGATACWRLGLDDGSTIKDTDSIGAAFMFAVDKIRYFPAVKALKLKAQFVVTGELILPCFGARM